MKADERVANNWHASQLGGRIIDRVIFQFQKTGKFVLIELLDPLFHVLRQHKPEEFLELRLILSEDNWLVDVNGRA